MNNHFIIDFETFGQQVESCPVINAAYYVFDWDRFTTNPYTLSELISSIKVAKLDVQAQVLDYGYVIEPSSIDFWMSLPKDVRSQTKPSPDDLSLPEFFDELIHYIEDKNVGYWWSRSNTFDPVILFLRAKRVGREPMMLNYLKFWKVRDVRTYIDAKFDFGLKHNGFVPILDQQHWVDNFKEHVSIYDVAADILRLQCIVRMDNGLDRI